MHILFVNQYGYDAPNTVNIDALCRCLHDRGHRCMLALPACEKQVEPPEKAPYGLLIYDFNACHLEQTSIQAIRAFAPDVVHAWVPRATAVLAAIQAAYLADAPLIINHEDDEATILRNAELDPSVRKLITHIEDRQPAPDLMQRMALDNNWYEWFARMSRAFSYTATDPVLYAIAHYRAAGFTAIWKPLTGKLSDAFDKPVHGLPPSLDVKRIGAMGLSTDRKALLEKDFGIPAHQPVILFLGTIYHFTEDFELLLHALGSPACRERDWHLVVTGRNQKPEITDRLIEYYDLRERYTFTGFQSGGTLQALIQRADIAACPGLNNDWNRYRLPTKLAYYMAAGKAVITYRAGFGEDLVQGKQALLTESDAPEELRDRLVCLLDDPALRETIGKQARVFAEQHFDIQQNVSALLDFYAERISSNDYPRRPTAASFNTKDPLRAALERLRPLLEQYSIHSVALYGAGKHTRRLLDYRNEDRSLLPCAVACIIDDQPAREAMDDIPVRGTDDALDIPFDALLLSSDAFELELFDRATQWLPRDRKILALYHSSLSTRA